MTFDGRRFRFKLAAELYARLYVALGYIVTVRPLRSGLIDVTTFGPGARRPYISRLAAS